MNDTLIVYAVMLFTALILLSVRVFAPKPHVSDIQFSAMADLISSLKKEVEELKNDNEELRLMVAVLISESDKTEGIEQLDQIRKGAKEMLEKARRTHKDRFNKGTKKRNI